MTPSLRSAGVLYLVMGVCTAFGMGYVDPSLYVPGDPEQSLERLRASASLARLGFAANLVGLVCLLGLGTVLYEVFAATNRASARLLLVFVVMGVAITCVSFGIQLTALELAGSARASQRELAVSLLELHRQGGYVAGVFWGLWLMPFGRLMGASGAAPKPLAVLLVAGGAGYVVNSGVHFFAPGIRALTYPAVAIAVLAEVSTIAWLLARGSRTAFPGR